MFWKKRNLPYRLNKQIPLNTLLEDMTFTVFDTETTGFAVSGGDRLIEIGAVQVKGLQMTEHTFQTYVNPDRDIPREIMDLTGIRQTHVKDAPRSLEAVNRFYQFVEDNQSQGWIGHYLAFDLMVLKKELQRWQHTCQEPIGVDTLDIIGYLNPSWDMRDLTHYARQFGANIYERHSALGDALTTASLFIELCYHLKYRNKQTLGDLLEAAGKNSGKTTSY
ncbi:3'-5' exonuclease [Salibacterium aidingense]|uniref:3'-5' exonuclease n=1 Tax=Salibacterium aidingense TaxID=384933 RepID=UPI0004172B9D|nr:exonuclease domain-containing protein [Salibacterium aidingense]